ncbi:uncharacterized protein LOC114570182 [Perca flavescens]|uniref:uncharacterized protein LOC114570182 n=1 Tax=Perca flavescens TaxID=8167 RepID=UPI00106E34A6|nr:uncharacterized protein LOC114570182 [Perca flavescens]
MERHALPSGGVMGDGVQGCLRAPLSKMAIETIFIWSSSQIVTIGPVVAELVASIVCNNGATFVVVPSHSLSSCQTPRCSPTQALPSLCQRSEGDDIATKRVSEMTPSTTRAGIKRPVTQEDKEWAQASLLQLGRFTGMGWILSPETPQTLPIKMFDGLVTSPGFVQAEDKALYVLSMLAVNDQEKQQIEEATVGQAKNSLWFTYRKKRITASNFGLVLAAVKRKSYPPSLFKTLLGQYNLKEGSKACDWGILHEPRAKQEYTERTGVVIQERGLFLSDSGLLGGSPDGTVFGNCVIEVKCPWSARTKTILQAAESRDFFMEFDEVVGSLTLKQSHNYWHQIQGNLHLTEPTAVTCLCGHLLTLSFCQCSKILHGL